MDNAVGIVMLTPLRQDISPGKKIQISFYQNAWDSLGNSYYSVSLFGRFQYLFGFIANTSECYILTPARAGGIYSLKGRCGQIDRRHLSFIIWHYSTGRYC